MTCVETNDRRTKKGYGRRWWKDRLWYSHRRAWVEANGPIPDGMMVCHRCDNPACINPEHLFIGTALDNNRDREAKGRRNVKGERNPIAKLTESQVREIRQRAAAGENQSQIGADYGVTNLTVNAIHRRRNWKHIQ